MNTHSEFDELKRLILGEEQALLERLRARVEDPKQRTEDVAEVLVSAIRSFEAQPDQRLHLREALEEPVATTLEHRIRRDPTPMAEALYPVIAPSVRRTVAGSLRAFVQNLNQIIEAGLSPRSWRWRLEAWRSGLHYREVVLRHILVYRVDQTFLIHNPSGLLIAERGHPDAAQLDHDAISAMLSALQSFVRDSFAGGDDDARLQTVEVGERTVLLAHGPQALLACVIRGAPAPELQEVLEERIATLHRDYPQTLQAFPEDNGDTLRPELEEALEPTLQSAYRGGHQPSRRRNPFLAAPFLGVVALALLVTGFSLWQSWHVEQVRARLADALDQAPGLTVTDWSRDAGRWVVSGLRDPLSISLTAVRETAGVPAEAVAFRMRPYRSLEPELVKARAAQQWPPPESVRLRITSNNELEVAGHATAEWYDRAQVLYASLGIPVRFAFTAQQSRPDDASLRERLQAQLAPPESVTVRVEQGQARLTGEAPLEWISNARSTDAEALGLTALDLSGLSVRERERATRIAGRLEGTEIRFSSYEWSPESASRRLDQVAQDVRTLADLAGRLEIPVTVRVIGDSDGTGRPDVNERVRQRRARQVAQALEARGVRPNVLAIRTSERPAPPGVPDPQRRRTYFEVELGPAN